MKTRFSTSVLLYRSLGAILTGIWLISSWPLSTRGVDSPPPDPALKKKEQKKTKKNLTGAELYAVHCNRCHPERYAPERTEVQWKTILTHMRVRANIPAEQARLIQKFLQEESGK
jgi:mono/diheme cytochrome c family protein